MSEKAKWIKIDGNQYNYVETFTDPRNGMKYQRVISEVSKFMGTWSGSDGYRYNRVSDAKKAEEKIIAERREGEAKKRETDEKIIKISSEVGSLLKGHGIDMASEDYREVKDMMVEFLNKKGVI